MKKLAQLLAFFYFLFLFLFTNSSNASKLKRVDNVKRQIDRNLRDLKVKNKTKFSNKLQQQVSDDEITCEDTDCYLLTMNSDETEQYYFYLDKYFPFNNFAVTDIQSLDSEWVQVPCDQETQFCFAYPSFSEPDKRIQKLIFTPSSPIIIDQQINITNINNNSLEQKSEKDEDDSCPAEGINIIASKAPEDQPVHVFLSSDNQVYIIIFDDTQHPVQKQSIFKENLNSYINANEKLACFDIEVYDFDDQSSNEQRFQDLPDNSQDCYLYVDCNIQDSTQPNEQIFAMVFIPLKKDPNNDIINSVGEVNVNRYGLKNKLASEYFYTCKQRISNTYSNTLVMFCPNPQDLDINSNLLFLKSLEKGANFPSDADIVFINLDPFQNPQCQNVSSFQIKAMVTNPLYSNNDVSQSYWQFAMLVSKQEDNKCTCSSICKCVLSEDDMNIVCSFIQLSDSCYHEMTYIQEDNVTLFVGSDSCIDEIQVVDTKNEDGQNLIVGSLSIGEANLILTKVTVNSQYIMAQMKDTSFTNKQNGNIDVVIKIFSRTNDNSFMHYYQKLESPVNLFQNDNFYDMGNYIMVYMPNTCILQVTRVTQKPLIISTQQLQEKYNLPQMSVIKFQVQGTYLAMNAQQIFETKSLQNLLIIQLVPYNQQVLDPEQTFQINSYWEQQTVSLPIKKGVTGSLLYFIYEPSVQNDKFQSLIDFNQTISVTTNFFDSKTIFYLQINDSNKLYNPPNFRVVLATYSTPCVIESYYCPITNNNKKYFTGDSCIRNFFKDLSVQGQQCNLDTYSEGRESSFVADKTERLGYVCEIVTNKQEQSYSCIKVEGDFVKNDELLDINGQIQGYSQVDFFSYSQQSILVTVTKDSKKLILYLLIPKYNDQFEVIAYCSQIFLVVDKYKLSSLDEGKIIQVDNNFLVEDFIFLLTSDLKIYTLTRIQQLYMQKQSECPDENYENQKKNNEKNIENSDDQLPSLDRLVHVSYVIDLKNQVQQVQGSGCLNSKYQQIFSLFGFDDNTISLVVLCYGNSVQIMQEFVFQNPFYCTWNRQFPFFNYIVDSEAPHFTDGKIIYIFTNYKLRIGEMKAYLMFNIYDFTPNSVIFEVITYYPQQYPDQFSFCESQNEASKTKKLARSKIPFTYFQFQKFYQDNPNPSLYAAPFTNNVKKSITMCLFSFEGQTIITYLNYIPTLYANAFLTNNDQINLNMIISKINLYDIHFNQYTLTFDFTDSQIQISDNQNQNEIVVQNSKQQSNVYSQQSLFPLDNITGPIESYQVQLFNNGKVTNTNDQLTSQNSFFGDYLSLQKYYFSFSETYFKYKDVQDIINFSSYQFSNNSMSLQDSNCQDCQNLIVVLSSQYLILIEKNQYNSGQHIPVSRIIKEFNLSELDKVGNDNSSYCRMTLNSNSQILIYCVSKKKSTTFKLYQVQYSKNNPFSATVELRQISSTGGYIGYVDYIIPFEYDNIVYLAIQTHYIQNQKTSIFKIATINCTEPNKNNHKNEENGCSLQVTQTFPTDNFQLTGAYIVDYDVQLIVSQDAQQQVNQQIFGLFLSEAELNIIYFQYVDKTFQAYDNTVFNSSQIKLLLNLTANQEDNLSLIFIKLINVVSFDNFTFLMGTNINMYEIQYLNNQYILVYTYGKYYQCEYISGYKPVIFNLNGAPLNYKTIFDLNLQSTSENPQFQIKSIMSSCSRQPTQNRPVFDPEPSIFQKQTESMFYIQYFVKNRTSKSWPVRILTLPQQSIATSYIFEGFTNDLGESRVLVSNYSYFLVEFQAHSNLNLNLTLAQNQADELSIILLNGFTDKQMNFTIKYDDTQSENKNEIWFIILIVVISLVAIIALVFIILWIKKQRNVKAEKKRERKNMISSGLTDLTDQQSEKNYQVRQYPAQSKLAQQQNYQPTYQQEERDVRPSGIYQPSERNKSQKYNRLSMQLDNLLRSVSMMNRRNNTGEHNNSEINEENNPNTNDYNNKEEDNYFN
ncbi:fibronectin type III, carboxy-terminal domain protein (macronuclear) [Tetrahymena thermophila SB210]|uniref:Fibronectin type III, carboxy-terminal domain protein n=1 Tax=Tetrahymena thermophila (strain SB210) TaxID=312017 RepID=Q235X1_TETTS|nr:fibronectin type III, carboxy-terminal domain protein [Tetrahymena thermophila SB210]EAR92629.2 fibronectin type III, carboxy-terminal domain protein [Tetrahymena thermophila SB210]|eukprot:XP_001012874.2 fibronectin type III, carboxy-terminal domain protein [Tetrahymena thermophila SB210]